MPVLLTDSNFDSFIDENKNVIIDFTASWCGPCKAMAPDYHKAEEKLEGSGIVFITIDIDMSPDTASKYSISSMPTLIVLKNRKVVEQSSGKKDCTKIIEMIGKHFDIKKFMN